MSSTLKVARFSSRSTIPSKRVISRAQFNASRRGPTTKNLAKSIKKINSKLELNHVDVFQNSVTIDDTAGNGVFTLLNGTATGDTDITREGNEIHATSIQFRGILASDTGQVGITFVRMILFWDSQPNGAAPTQATLLDTSVITNANFSPYNRDFQKRYKIIYDRLMMINPQQSLTVTTGATDTTATVAQFAIPFKKKIALNRMVKYSGATAAITDIATNSLYLYQVSNQGNASGLEPVVVAGYRFYFKDA